MYLPLHKLWQDYMKNMLNLQANRYVTKAEIVCMIMNLLIYPNYRADNICW